MEDSKNQLPFIARQCRKYDGLTPELVHVDTSSQDSSLIFPFGLFSFQFKAMEEESDPMTWDLYEIVGDGTLGIESTTKDIQRAYKKKALKVHPDKNPSSDAAKQFDRLQKAYEILMDDQKRAAYNNRIKAKLERKRREAEQDAATLLMKKRLQEREKAALAAHFKKGQEAEEKRAQQENAEVLAELLKTQRRFVRHAQSSVSDFAAAEAARQRAEEVELTTVQVTWRPTKKRRTGDTEGSASAQAGAPNEETLRKLFGMYGEIASVIMKPAKGKAYLVFTSRQAARAAVQHGPAGGDAAFEGLTVTLKDADPQESTAGPAPSEYAAPPRPSSSPSPTPFTSSSSSAGSAPAQNGSAAAAAPTHAQPAATAAPNANVTEAAHNLDSFEADILARMMAMAAKRKQQQAQTQTAQDAAASGTPGVP